MKDRRVRRYHQETLTDSFAAIPLSGCLFPLIGRQNPAVRQRRGFRPQAIDLALGSRRGIGVFRTRSGVSTRKTLPGAVRADALDHYLAPPLPLHALYSHNGDLSAKVLVFVAASFGQEPLRDDWHPAQGDASPPDPLDILKFKTNRAALREDVPIKRVLTL